ncbi:MAG TPA: hypothetical protein VKQ52_22520, partial [Puia sp.]|nr:hypothetical protein [Puia sp.]
MKYPDLRSLTRIDTALIYRTVTNKMISDFYYDPTDVTTADDSAMTIVTLAGKRLKRYTQGVLYPRWFGAAADGITDDSYAIQKMFNYITLTNATHYWKVYFEGLTYNIGDGIDLPMLLADGSTSLPHIDIDGGGAVIKTSHPKAMFRRVPGNDAMAQSLISSWIGEIHNFEFRGTQASGQVALDLGACYSWHIHNNHFMTLDTAIKARFFLQDIIAHNRFTNNRSICIWMKWGDWTGGTTAGDANNADIIESNRFYNWDSAYAALYMLAGNKNTIRNNVSEGNKPVYEFFYDYSGSTNVVSTEIHDWYSETVPGKIAVNTLFNIRMSGTFDIDNVTSIYPCVLLNLDNSGTGSILNVDNFNFYEVADTPFSARQAGLYGLNIGKTGKALFNLVNAASHWSGNVIPAIGIMYVGANQDGSTIYTAGAGAAQINGRLVVGAETDLNGYLVANSTLYANGYTYHNYNVFMNNAPIVFQNSSGSGSSIGARLTDSSFYIGSQNGWFSKQGKNGNWLLNTKNIDAPTPVALSVLGTDAIKIPLGNTAQRPTGDSAYYRFNRDSLTNELHDGGSWQAIATRNWVRANSSANVFKK